MSDFINTVDTLGEEETLARLVQRTITEYSDDRVKSIGAYAFNRCDKLRRVRCPNAKSIGYEAFGYCDMLSTTYFGIDLPNIIDIGDYAFVFCDHYDFRQVSFSKVVSIGLRAFYYCLNLTKASFHNATSIGELAFESCRKLQTVIVGTNQTTVATVGANTFRDTPIASGTGYIYVPDDLVDAYKSATNWSTYASQIKGISELT